MRPLEFVLCGANVALLFVVLWLVGALAVAAVITERAEISG